MRLGGRVQAAIEVLSDMETRKRPASEALKDWGLAHRFAGSGDRNAIGNLVYDALRKKTSTAYAMGEETPVNLAFGALHRQWGTSLEQIQEAFLDDKFAPEIPVDALKASIEKDFAFAPPHEQADVPEWCANLMEESFGEDWISEAEAMAERPPLDIRVNTLKSNREKVAKELVKAGVEPTTVSKNGLRIAAGSGAKRLPNVTADAAFQKGWFEIQDEGSQIVSDLVFAQAGEQVLDYCAGAGGKSLALSATMQNKGQIHAYDINKRRLAPIFERIKRAGTRNVQVHNAGSDLKEFENKFDRVLVDAPCTGSGTWRRRPDSKWKLTPETLAARQQDQIKVLDEAMKFVKPGGFLSYVTCSIFQEENEEQVYGFGERHKGWELLSAGEVWQDLYGVDGPKPWSSDMKCVTLTPASTNTDGFFFAVLQKLK